MKKSARITVHKVAKRIAVGVLFAFTLGMWGVAAARLPPPTPEEIAKKAAEAEAAKDQLAKEQAALTRVQDSVVLQYRSDLIKQGITPPAPTPVGATPISNLPKTLVDAPRNAGPHGGNTPSAEAHSGNAK